MLVFFLNSKQGDNIPMGTPNRAVKCKPRNGYAKITIFDQYIAFIIIIIIMRNFLKWPK